MKLVRMIKKNSAWLCHLDPALCEGIAEYSDTNWLYETFGIDFRRKTPPGSTKADLEAVLGDHSDVDLSGLDKLLSEYGIAGEKFTTAEQKLYRLFYAVLMERPAILVEILWGPLKGFGRMLKRMLKRYLPPIHHNALKRMAFKLRNP